MSIFIGVASVSPAHANSKYAGIVIDAKTGKTLYNYRGDNKRFPASLTKMMTVYMMLEAMEQGKLSRSTRIQISPHAASMVPSKLGIRAGGSLTAEHAIYALVTKSANDVAAAVAEHLGGTESGFARMMTAKARQLGMKSTVFKNASGLPNSQQVTTARDMARLGLALREHYPAQYKYFSTRSFTYGKSTYRNHNRLLGRIKGVDGIKTGYTRASGFNLVSSVQADGRSIVAVVLGGRTGASRNAQMEKLIREYLPRASKRGAGNLIAKNGSTSFKSVANLATLSPSRLPDPYKNLRPQMRTDDLTIASAYAPTPKRPSVAVDAITTATTNPRTGWVIQIASLETRGEAMAYLNNAQSTAPSILGVRQAFIEQFDKNGVRYHRARFAGFNSKSDAWGACEQLKKHNYACLAFES
ncbi:MAG: D-alanyl-D-alanine carboxypeptidase family protein [Pseudomonadota bacterium]